MLRRMERPGDTDVELNQRRILFPVHVFVWCITAIIILLSGDFDKAGTAVWLSTALAGNLCILVGLLLLIWRAPVDYRQMFSIEALFLAAVVLVLDITNLAMMRMRIWPLIVLLMDLLLILEAAQLVQVVICVLTLGSLAVASMEAVYRFGVYDLVLVNTNVSATLCDCSSPPCPMPFSTSLSSWMVVTVIFLVDFYVTRGFSTSLRQQLDMSDTTVRVAGRVTELLAAYATDDARKVVAAEGDQLPEALRDAYEQLLDNLDSYRVFLPDTVLLAAQQAQGEEDALGQEAVVAKPPREPPGLGMDTPTVAICFTDIQSSTELWEMRPQGMYDGLNLHNVVMRRVYEECDGYEVKTIGDSFMVAFDTSTNALRFGLGAQQGLLKQEWPEDLLTHHLCTPMSTQEGVAIWGGLRVRIGVGFGAVRVERNPVTGRCDYFGPTVNTAARLEAALKKGGTVATTKAVLSAQGSTDMEELGNPVVREVGPMELKGCQEKAEVVSLVPQGLESRFAVLVAAGVLEDCTTVTKGSGLKPGVLLNVGASAQSRRRASHVSTSASAIRRPKRGSRRASFLLTQNAPGSGSDGSVSSVSRGHQPKGLARQQLQRTEGTCAVARCALVHMTPQADRLPFFVAAASLAADRSQGVVDAVLSACVYVTWNTSKPCAAHITSCSHFMAVPMRAPFHLGVVSGPMLHGTVAAGRRKFATVAGGIIELAAALAEEAERCGDGALAVGALAEESAKRKNAHRAQIWRCPSNKVQVVWFIDTTAADQETWELEMDPSEPLPGQGEGDMWADAVPALFAKACSATPGTDEYDAILSEVEQCAARPEAANLLARMKDGTVRTRYLPQLWAPTDPHRAPSRQSRVPPQSRTSGSVHTSLSPASIEPLTPIQCLHVSWSGGDQVGSVGDALQCSTLLSVTAPMYRSSTSGTIAESGVLASRPGPALGTG